jgi:hypothetical protein
MICKELVKLEVKKKEAECSSASVIPVDSSNRRIPSGSSSSSASSVSAAKEHRKRSLLFFFVRALKYGAAERLVLYRALLSGIEWS